MYESEVRFEITEFESMLYDCQDFVRVKKAECTTPT